MVQSIYVDSQSFSVGVDGSQDKLAWNKQRIQNEKNMGKNPQEMVHERTVEAKKRLKEQLNNFMMDEDEDEGDTPKGGLNPQSFMETGNSQVSQDKQEKKTPKKVKKDAKMKQN